MNLSIRPMCTFVKRVAKRLTPRKVWATLRLMKLKFDVKRFPQRNVQHIYGGWALTVHLADALAKGWYDHDWPVLPEVELLSRRQLKPGATVFDIGAHQGIVALMLSRLVGSTGKVIAVEANPHNLHVMAINRKLNDAANIVVVHAAAAEQSGVIQFNEGLNGHVETGSGEWGKIEVQATSIDELAITHGTPGVLFIDVEGFECRVLRGAQATLRSTPDCFVEVHVGAGLETFGGSAAEAIAFFPNDRYDLHVGLEGEPLRQLLPGAALPRLRFFLVAIGKHGPSLG